MKIDIKSLLEFAGVDITKGKAKQLVESSTQRLDKLIGYYIDGYGGFPDNPDKQTKRVMQAVEHLNGKDLSTLSPDEQKMAQDILSYGTEVEDKELSWNLNEGMFKI